MICSKCGQSANPQQRFCGECGARLSGAAGHTVSTGGGDVHGGIYQAGRDVVVNPAPNVPPQATYEVVPKWRSPFTQGVLAWSGLVLGLVGIFPLWKVLQPVLDLFNGVLAAPAPGLGQNLWVWVLMPVVFMLVLVMSLHRLVKLQLRKPLFPGWALSGTGRRVTLEKIRAGDCPQCGGRMRYYSKATAWDNYIYKNGSKRRKVTERVPALECKRNPKHWFPVDPAEDKEV